MTRLIAVAILATSLLATPALAKKAPPPAWQATRTTDPVTGISRCVVSALDYAGKMRFSRTGYLYPVIEKHPQHGLLVGVSSGGPYRLPTGTILWRVDQNTFREIKPEDGPALDNANYTMPALPAGTDPAAAKAMQDTVNAAMRMTAGLTATSTFAMGDTAAQMLAELRAGQGLIFRAAALTTTYGLPNRAAGQVGQYTKDGLRPIPLDASLAAALGECGIG